MGEALIGDYQSAGIQTRGEYRHALDILILNKILIKVETCRNRKKATTGTTTTGTKVRLLDSTICDINLEDNNHRNNHRTTTEQPPNNHEEEAKERKNIKKSEKESEKEKVASPPPSLASSPPFCVKNTEEDLKVLMIFVSENNLSIRQHVLGDWLKKYESNYIVNQLAIVMKRKPKNIEALMNKALKEDFADETIRKHDNANFAMMIKNENDWKDLKLNKSCCTNTLTGNDYQYHLPRQTFKDALLNSFRNMNILENAN
jgi:hypothetical protein